MRNYYVYIYLDPRKPGKYKYGEYEFNYEPFYVGKGKGRRCKANCGRTQYFKNKINNIKKSGLEPLVTKLEENLNEEKSFLLEFKLIDIVGRKDLNKGPLINFTNGGEGCSGWICSEETRKLMRENHANFKGKNHPMYGIHRFGKYNPMFGKHHSEEAKRKQSDKKKGIKCPEHSKRMKGRSVSEKTKKLISEKQRGENNSRSILTEKNVIEIRIDLKEEILTHKEIGKKFGVHQTTISHIKTRRIWKHNKDNLINEKFK